MYVCLCNAITDRAIRKAVEEQGVGNIRDLRRSLGVANQCGKCAQVAQTIIDQTIVDSSLFKEVS
ncbi:(2Fe-2S)-binding protein [Paraneptunicella aestuarii]|uniref:(2Fe-2S)-binding protein n=1 Tax=Paraneptunicella aestuarii TaxID=2831148 RepID=UPI001E47F066|nr:(2Fe-2S)-binding protein [Paraneptunicella aestuarii]UAA37920.1 (2Fe-2S)-binding protein [Paraneptunicella aestuarii]